VHIPYIYFKIITFLLYINFLLFNMANNNLNYSLSNLPNIRVLLSRPYVIPAASAPPSSTSFRVPQIPGDC